MTMEKKKEHNSFLRVNDAIVEFAPQQKLRDTVLRYWNFHSSFFRPDNEDCVQKAEKKY